MAGPVTFTLDLEDHRAPESTEERYPELTRRVLEFLRDRRVRGTFFVTGEIADARPISCARSPTPATRSASTVGTTCPCRASPRCSCAPTPSAAKTCSKT